MTTMKTAIGSLLLCAALSATGARAATINYALGATATASGRQVSGALPSAAIDGDLGTFWNAGGGVLRNGPPQHIEIDLGETISLATINAHVLQLPPGVTNHNVYLDGVLSFSWNQRTANRNKLTYEFDTPVNAQIVRIETTMSPSWVAWWEIELIGSPAVAVAPIPLPASGLLLFAGLAALARKPRRKS